MAKLSNVAKLLRDLVALPSVNPAFLPNEPELTGEERVASYLTELTSKQGLEISRQNVLPGLSRIHIRPRRRRLTTQPRPPATQ